MFDDQLPQNQGQVPGGLPVGEPDDMFSEVDKVEGENKSTSAPDTPQKQSVVNEKLETASVPAPASALSSGALRPVEKPEQKIQTPTPTAQSLSQNQNLNSEEKINTAQTNAPEVYSVKEPTLTRGLVTIIIVLIGVLILGFGGWWIYSSFIKTEPVDDFQNIIQGSELDSELDLETDTILPVEVLETDQDVVEPVITENLDEVLPEESIEAEDELGQEIIDDQILFGEPIDKDGDGLDDEREADVGSDPNNWDSDGDELSDGDEVIIWKTDPLNPDSDGDSYLDGHEVKNGYNPTGEGKLFEPPQAE